METIPISLPFDFPEGASVRVFVLPEKQYGQCRGTELIQKYGVGVFTYRESKPYEYIHWEENDNLCVFQNILKGDTQAILNRSGKPLDLAIITTIYFPYGELQEKIRIGKHYYVLKNVVHILEDIQGKKILCLYDNRVVKTMINKSIEVTLQETTLGLVVFGRKGNSYLLKRGE